jgi:hypothetical protein
MKRRGSLMEWRLVREGLTAERSNHVVDCSHLPWCQQEEEGLGAAGRGGFGPYESPSPFNPHIARVHNRRW